MDDKPEEMEEIAESPSTIPMSETADFGNAPTRVDEDTELSGAPVEMNLDDLEGQEIRGRFRYRVGGALGSGGFGSVHLAICLDTDGEDGNPAPISAVKFFKEVSGGGAMAFLRREVSAIVAIDNPHIPKITDWSPGPPLPFMVMEYYPLGSVADRMGRGGRMDEHQAWTLLSDLMEALNAAHRESVLHLDIKPHNILVNNDYRYLLTDFSISQGSLVSDQIVALGRGTPNYNSPEQDLADIDSIGPRTDLYGVGVTIWSLMTGVNLSANRDVVRRPEHGFSHALPPLHEVLPGVSRALSDLVFSLTANNVDDRPGGAAECLRIINAARSGDDSVAVTETLQHRASPSDEARRTILGMMDPLWITLLADPFLNTRVVRYTDGEYLGKQGEKSYVTFILLSGVVVISRNGEVIAEEKREGTFLGEVSTLTGSYRTASMIAHGDVTLLALNASQFEEFVTLNPAVAIRLIKTLAYRLADERERNSKDEE